MSMLLIVSLALVTAATLLVAHTETRRRLLIRPLLARFRKVMPAMSDTEREALEAGTVWWDGELFSGRPDWNRLLDLKAPALRDDERAFLDGPVEELCRMLDDWRITHEDRDLPPGVWDFIRRNGFFGLVIPRAYGGLAFSARAHSEVVMRLASRSVTAAVTVMVPNSLGPGELLLHYGTERQKRRWLPRLARGQEIPCFALTGPEAGSDAASLPDTGIVCMGEHRGRSTLGIRLTWDKRYITLGPVATVLGLAFRLRDPDGLLDLREDLGITLALIPRNTPGVEIGERHVPLDIPFQNGPNRGRDVFIPLDWVIGGRRGIGQGWRMLMESLSAGRGVSLPALATGAGKLACRATGAYARVRRQFGRPIGEFEGVEEALARIAGLTYQMDAARSLLLTGLDAGERPGVLSAICKYQLTERYRRVINDAMDLEGGHGICLGPANWLARTYQAIPIAITVEGANILTRNLILFGQGAMRCHPWLRQELAAAHSRDPEDAEPAFDRAIRGHLGWLLGNLGRTLLLGLSRGRLARVPGDPELRRHLRRLQWLSSAFALSADLSLMTLGGSLKRRERLSARLGDVLSALYLGSAAVRRYLDDGQRPEDLPLLRWAMEDHLKAGQDALAALWRNLPLRPLAWALRRVSFPFRLPFAGPGDALDRQVARLLLSPSEARDRLVAGIHLPDGADEPLGRLERAFLLAQRTDPLERTLTEARRNGLVSGPPAEARRQALAAELLTGADREALEDMERLRALVVRVDAFRDYGRADAARLPVPWDAHAA